MKRMIIIIGMLLCSCKMPEKIPYETIGNAKIYRVVPADIGYDLFWQDSRNGLHKTFVKDTLMFKKGFVITTFIHL
jgi:hypothetical protein